MSDYCGVSRPFQSIEGGTFSVYYAICTLAPAHEGSHIGENGVRWPNAWDKPGWTSYPDQVKPSNPSKASS